MVYLSFGTAAHVQHGHKMVKGVWRVEKGAVAGLGM